MEEKKNEVSCDHMNNTEIPRARPGIMLLTSSMQLLYKNWWASEVCRKIIQCQAGKTANGGLPLAIASLVDEICQILKLHADPKDWEQIHISRHVNLPDSSVQLCGIALIDQTTAETRIVIVLGEVGIGAWEDNILVEAKERFQLHAKQRSCNIS